MINMQNVIQNFLQIGKQVEANFAETLLKSLGGVIHVTDQQTDMLQHIDLYWQPNEKNKRRYGIDVKGIKRNSRNEELDDSIHWLEFQNVVGKKGWLYGKAEMFAFETNKSWLLIGKNKLIVYALSRCEDKQRIYTKMPEPYHLYQRFNRKDIIMKVKTSDLEEIADKILWK